MTRSTWWIAGALALLPLTAFAADVPYVVTLDGRALTTRSANSTGAVSRDGVVFIDAVTATKAFDGLLTQRGRDKVLTITIHHNTGIFTLGSKRAVVDRTRVRLLGAPFRVNGDLFVPIVTLAHIAGAGLRIDARGHAAALTSPVSPPVGPGSVVTPVPHGT